MNRAIEFAAFIAARESLEREWKAASAELQQFPKGALGLTPDSVKFSPEFRAAKARYSAAFAALQRLNSANAKRFAPELRARALRERKAMASGRPIAV